MVGCELDAKDAHFKGKEDISRNWWFNAILPTRIGFSCSLIIFSHVSKFSILFGVVLVRN